MSRALSEVLSSLVRAMGEHLMSDSEFSENPLRRALSEVLLSLVRAMGEHLMSNSEFSENPLSRALAELKSIIFKGDYYGKRKTKTHAVYRY